MTLPVRAALGKVAGRLPSSLRSARSWTWSVYERARLPRRPLVLVSNNCWGYELYHSLQQPYLTPFVGTFVHPHCYVRLLRDRFPHDLDIREFTDRSRYSPAPPPYPVGVLSGGEEIHFLHHGSIEQAADRWRRRVDRMLRALDSAGAVVAAKMCDRDGCTTADLDEFHLLPLRRRLSIGVRQHPSRCHVTVPALRDPAGHHVVDGLSLYRRRYAYFDLTEWLLTGTVRHTGASRILGAV